MGRELWKGKTKHACVMTEKKQKCFWTIWNNDRKRRLSDGDCVQEGWRIDDLYGPYHGTPGRGGLLDAIYPKSIRGSFIDEKFRRDSICPDSIEFIKKAILGAKAYAAARKREIGKDITPITLSQLQENIKRDWSTWADELVGVNGECQGPFRKRVPAIVTFEEAFFWQKQKDSNLTIGQFQRDFKSYTQHRKRQIYHEIVAVF